MKISDAGLDLIKDFEGYHDRQPNGDARAYRCPAGVWTIGHGVTEGIQYGMVWTKEECDEALLREISEHERHVKRLATVELNQNEYDALVSFCYNCGPGALGRSTLLKKLNKGDRRGAAKAFKLWNKGGGRVLRGLVDRRAREATLFLTPIEGQSKPDMAQKVGKSRAPVPVGAKVGAGLVAGSAVTIPTPPATMLETVTSLQTWQTHLNNVMGLLQYSASHWPWVLAAGGAYAVIAHGLPWIGRRAQS